MEYEVIRDIKNSCSGNQMRDIFFKEISTDDPDRWIRTEEPDAEEWEREEIDHGIRYYVRKNGMLTVYSMSEI